MGDAAAGTATDPSALPTSTKWSVLSSRVEGLVAELSEVVGKQDAYCVSVSRCEGDVMAAVRDKMLTTPWGDLWEKKQTMFSYGEEMSTDPLEAMLLKQLAFMAAPRRVLEIGMFVGYGSVAMLEGSPETDVVSLEIDPYLKGWLAECLEPFPDISARHEVVVGPALDSLPKLHGQFDMVFVDANKAEYKRYVELIIQHKLLSSRGVIVCDNVLYNGYPYAHQHFDSQPARRHFGDAIREFNQWVADHPKLEQVVLPVRDGISIIKMKPDQFLGVKKPAPKKPVERMEAADVPPPPTPIVKRGNLVHYDHTWRIIQRGDNVPAGAICSDCSVEPGVSEYASGSSEYAEGSGAKAWSSRSTIEFEYRVVEVPRGRLLDPNCDALVFGHLAHGSEERAEAMKKPQRRLVVIDETVNNLYGDRVRAYFKACGVDHELLVLPMTEETKNMETALQVTKKMKQFNIDRRTEPVLAIGGGVCLDVVGLAASLFRRRTPYIRVPTTALSYVDASVGAKNGVNFAGSKNRLGTYVPPCAAILDPMFIETQGNRDVANGVGEMCKMAIMKSPELYALLEQNGPRLVSDKFAPCSKDDEAPARVLQLAIETMLEELSPNLWENSLDRLVDFGHAVGQDLEMAALGTKHELMHGESVTIDMALSTCLSQQIGLVTKAERDRTLSMLRNCQLPVWSPVMTYELFTEAVANRVKNSMGQRFPLPAGIGKGMIVNDVSDDDLRSGFMLWQELCGKASDKISDSFTGA